MLVTYQPVKVFHNTWSVLLMATTYTAIVHSSDVTIATVQALANRLEPQMAAAADKAILEEIVRERTMFAERAASLNGMPVHPMRLVHELQTLLSDDMTLCLDMGSFHIWLATSVQLSS